MDKTRRNNLKQARTLQIWNVVYDVIEVVVSLIAGFTANSSALIGWGLDSTIEVVSAGTLGWRLHGEIKGIDEEKVKRRQKITLNVIAISFTLICIFISYDSITKLINKETANWSTLGLIILLVSLVVNPILIYFKRKYGKKLDSPALLADAKDTFICLYQTVVVLIGLLLVNWLGWWWADPVAALLIVPYAAKEGWEAYNKAKNINHNTAQND
ncbi:cation diffusion facilitator family transporter [Nonlabens dokdonensis]|jgi:cation diffusion facilitator family transporter|uniref:Cation diffusion facilitator family transporter n=2 Tax=Nonlabens dokdonensis TaxID=328515 RepID=A0ABX5Q0J2_9FLAO|nr:cation transporter [Nonlabens dokdonensis]AGC75866.1 putative integral membrane protein [Nonlabens dokdonensis DSW-6]PZX43549.1 cation diffusion facilitator family transporter [Nonlabens dokdonensis]